MLAVANAEGSYYRYLKLMLLARKPATSTVNRKKEIGNGEHNDMALAQRVRPVSDSLLPISHSPERMRIAVILTTYNRPDALALVLESYLAQDTHAFELIVADDGSTGDTRRVVEDYRHRAPFELQHVWQEDLGFRPAAIRNRALAATSADCVVFSDGDCIAPPTSWQRSQLSARFPVGQPCLLRGAFTRSDGATLPLTIGAPGLGARWLRNDASLPAAAAAARWRLPQTQTGAVGGGEDLQSLGLARRPRARQRSGRVIHRMGPGRFRPGDTPAANRRKAQERALRRTSVSSLAQGFRPQPPRRQSAAA